MIIRARAVVTMNGPPLEDGAVVVTGERIRAAGKWVEMRSAGGEVIDLGDSILLPGLINAHCHLEYTMLRGALPRRPASFTDWIKCINAQKAALGPDDYGAAMAEGLAEAMAFGTTTIADLEGNAPSLPGGDDGALPASARVWRFAEMIDVRRAVSAEEMLKTATGLAPHAPFTASPELYAETTRLSREHDRRWTTHLAESRDEMEMFCDGRGPLFDFLQGLGRGMDDCGGRTPLRLMLDRGLLDERSIVAHLNEVEQSDFALLANAPRFPIVHCPRSHVFLGHSPFALERLRALGYPISLATDSLASNEDLSLFSEMQEAARVWPGLAPGELLEMVTIHPACALGRDKELGRIAPGFFADLVAIPGHFANSDTLAEIVGYEGKVGWLMVAGRPILAS